MNSPIIFFLCNLLSKATKHHMSLVRLNIKGISYSQTQNGAYALILNEVNGSRKLPIVIGAYEAQAIAIELEKEIKPPRPLTHDLFKDFAQRFHITIKQVIIHKLVDGVFFSSIICESAQKEEIIDARTSDAIALALRFGAPIFTYKDILNKAGVQLKLSPSDDTNEENIEKEHNALDVDDFLSETSNKLASTPLKDLKDMLEEAVTNEDYETAAIIRDEISKR